MTDVLVCVSIHLDVYVAVFGIYRESSHISGNFRLTSENLQIDGGVAILGQAEINRKVVCVRIQCQVGNFRKTFVNRSIKFGKCTINLLNHTKCPRIVMSFSRLK